MRMLPLLLLAAVATATFGQDAIIDQYYLIQSLKFRAPYPIGTEDNLVVNSPNCPEHEVTTGSYKGMFTGTGTRKLIYLDAALANIGSSDWDLRPYQALDPCSSSSEPAIMNLTRHTLYNSSGAKLATTYKDYYAISDMRQYLPSVPPQQSILDYLPWGWADVYSGGGDYEGEFLDVTNVAAGEYTMEVTVNPGGVIPEVDTTNNASLVTFTLNNNNTYSMSPTKTLSTSKTVSGVKYLYGMESQISITAGTYTIQSGGYMGLRAPQVSITKGSIVVTSGRFSAASHFNHNL
jgi:hypothetical protein